MSDNQLLELIERYLDGEMSQEERVSFEKLRKENADVESRLVEHRLFLNTIKQYSERLDLEKRLNAIHDEIDVHALKEEATVRPSWIIQLWRNHHSKISVAASVAIFAMLLTMFFTGYFNKSDYNYTALRRQMESTKRSADNLNHSTNQLINDLRSGQKIVNPGKYGGTGFAVSSNGYIVTNYHVISGADSVYVQNVNGDSYKTKPVFVDPQYDVAILKITDTTFKSLGPLPYGFKKSKSDLGENVFTYGYPTDYPVFGEGSLSSQMGFNGDSLAYRVSIPVNPGNSGGPLFDSKGNVIGIISGKQALVEGAAFAIKSNYLYKAIQSDTLANKITLSSKNVLANLSRPQQIKKLQNYVFMVKVYN